MDKIIDINLLKNMPITDEFAQILFGCNSDEIEAIIEPKYSNAYYKIKNDNKSIVIYEDGSISIHEPNCGDVIYLTNAFQIVRYIDNYLASQKV